MATHQQRLAAAREAIEFICSRSDEEMTAPVPNCPGWTIYNAAVHIGRVGIAWQAMIDASPDDPDSRVRGYGDAEARGAGHAPAELASWALGAIDALDDDVNRACYFSMTGGTGSVGLWGWHAASELGVHRLDVEAALGISPALSDDLAIDAIEYTASYFLPAMARVSQSDPGALDAVAVRDGAVMSATKIRASQNDATAAATLRGAPVDLLLELWGRPHGPVTVEGAQHVADQWHALPGTAFQFGTWD